jgi:hypothetical protein
LLHLLPGLPPLLLQVRLLLPGASGGAAAAAGSGAARLLRSRAFCSVDRSGMAASMNLQVCVCMDACVWGEAWHAAVECVCVCGQSADKHVGSMQQTAHKRVSLPPSQPVAPVGCVNVEGCARLGARQVVSSNSILHLLFVFGQTLLTGQEDAEHCTRQQPSGSSSSSTNHSRQPTKSGKTHQDKSTTPASPQQGLQPLSKVQALLC